MSDSPGNGQPRVMMERVSRQVARPDGSDDASETEAWADLRKLTLLKLLSRRECENRGDGYCGRCREGGRLLRRYACDDGGAR